MYGLKVAIVAEPSANLGFSRPEVDVPPVAVEIVRTLQPDSNKSEGFGFSEHTGLILPAYATFPASPMQRTLD